MDEEFIHDKKVQNMIMGGKSLEQQVEALEKYYSYMDKYSG